MEKGKNNEEIKEKSHEFPYIRAIITKIMIIFAKWMSEHKFKLEEYGRNER